MKFDLDRTDVNKHAIERISKYAWIYQLFGWLLKRSFDWIYRRSYRKPTLTDIIESEGNNSVKKLKYAREDTFGLDTGKFHSGILDSGMIGIRRRETTEIEYKDE